MNEVMPAITTPNPGLTITGAKANGNKEPLETTTVSTRGHHCPWFRPTFPVSKHFCYFLNI